MIKPVLFALATVLAGSANAAGNCDAIRDQIDAKIKSAGVLRYTLTTVNTGDNVEGRTVGSCDLGKKKIVYRQDAGSAPAVAQAQPGPARHDGVLTECRDGSVSVGGDCRKR